jgi:hypothetical protein
MKGSGIIVQIISWVIAIVIVGLLTALPVMFLWNWVMPDIFGLTTIDFKQALCIALLSKCLFSGYKSSKGGDKNE